jgi:hypothetical protein
MNNHTINIIDAIIRSHGTKINGTYFCESHDLSEAEIKTLCSTLFTFDEHFKELVKTYVDSLFQSRSHYAEIRGAA